MVTEQVGQQQDAGNPTLGLDRERLHLSLGCLDL